MEKSLIGSFLKGRWNHGCGGGGGGGLTKAERDARIQPGSEIFRVRVNEDETGFPFERLKKRSMDLPLGLRSSGRNFSETLGKRAVRRFIFEPLLRMYPS